MTTFAQRLKDLREQAGLTQEQLAQSAGIPLGTLRDYEQGLRRTDPTLRVAVRLARALGVSVDRFADALGIDFTAFTTTPADRPAQGRGRPRKAPGVSAGASSPAEEADCPTATPNAPCGTKKGRGKGKKGSR